MNEAGRAGERPSAVTVRLHEAFLQPLAGAMESSSDIGRKPLLVDLGPPHPPRLRVYLYSLVHGAGERQRREYKIVLRVPGQSVDGYGRFDHSDGRFTILAGYDSTLDVFVLWDAVLHPRFTNGGNLQVRDEIVRKAAAVGGAEQVRRLGNGSRELVLACQSHSLAQALAGRVASTGGLEEGECVNFLT